MVSYWVKKLTEISPSGASLLLPIVHSCLTVPEQKSALHKNFGLWSQEHHNDGSGQGRVLVHRWFRTFRFILTFLQLNARLQDACCSLRVSTVRRFHATRLIARFSSVRNPGFAITYTEGARAYQPYAPLSNLRHGVYPTHWDWKINLATLHTRLLQA